MNDFFSTAFLWLKLLFKVISFDLHIEPCLFVKRHFGGIWLVLLLNIEIRITLSSSQWMIKTNIVLCTYIFSCWWSLFIIRYAICIYWTVHHHIKIIKYSIIFMYYIINLGVLLIICWCWINHWSLYSPIQICIIFIFFRNLSFIIV